MSNPRAMLVVALAAILGIRSSDFKSAESKMMAIGVKHSHQLMAAQAAKAGTGLVLGKYMNKRRFDVKRLQKDIEKSKVDVRITSIYSGYVKVLSRGEYAGQNVTQTLYVRKVSRNRWRVVSSYIDIQPPDYESEISYN